MHKAIRSQPVFIVNKRHSSILPISRTPNSMEMSFGFTSRMLTKLQGFLQSPVSRNTKHKQATGVAILNRSLPLGLA
jgi:hypothetical protein